MRSHEIRRITASVLILTLSSLGLLNTAVPAVAGGAGAASPGTDAADTRIVGQLTATSGVTINDKKAINGTSVFTNSRIKVACAKGNSAMVSLGRMGRVELSPGAQLILRFSEGVISGELTDGDITVKAPAGVKVSITTQNGVAASDGSAPAVLPVKAQRGVRCVPTVIPGSASASAIGAAPLAALLAGAGAAGILGAVAGGGDDNNAASNVVP